MRPASSTGLARAWTDHTSVRKRKTGSKHHLICDGRGIPLDVVTTVANVNDITQTLNLVDGIPPVAGRPGRPRRRPESVLGDKAADRVRTFAPQHGDQLGELTRAQPGERGYPRRLQHRDHTSHDKIISSVTSSYGTRLSRGFLACPIGRLCR